MESNPQQKERRFSVNLESEELNDVLSQIDKCLKQHQQILSPIANNNEEVVSKSPEIFLENFDSYANWLQMSSAPLRPSIIGGYRGFIWRVLNAPVRFFIPSQIGFNQNLREFISELRTIIHAVNNLLIAHEQKVESLDQLKDSLQVVGDLQVQLESLQEKLTNQLISLHQRTSQLESLQEKIQQIDSIQIRMKAQEERQLEKDQQVDSIQTWMKTQEERQFGNEKWLQLIGVELHDLALETRASKVETRDAGIIPQVKIIHPDELAKKIQSMGGEIKLNLGAGHKPIEGYLNVDYRDLYGIDLVSGVDNLPFSVETVDEIASAHLIEHFREYDFTSRLLPYWHSLLKKGGKLRITCPNWQAMINHLNAGTMSLSHFKLLTFGGQEYEGNDHFSMYTPESLSMVLVKAGFINLQIITEDRDNGGCPEMELLAEKGE